MNLNRSYTLLGNHPAIVLFEELLQVSSISGHEARLAALIRARLSGMGYESETDAAGNILVRLAGTQPVGPLVCYAAHMDEIGMVVTSINDDGSLNVSRSGGLFPWKLGEGPVDIIGDSVTLTGILSMGSTHTTTAGQQAIEWTDVRVISGLKRSQLEDAGIRAGTPVAPIQSVRGPHIFGDPGDPLVAAWTFDDRMGCVALLRFLDTLKRDQLEPQCPTIVVFTVGEEVGGLGAKSLALREQPDVFISIDGSPTPAEAPLKLDGRPGIWAKDRLATYDQPLLRALLQAAEAAGTQLQTAAYTSAACDASLVRYAGLAPRIACIGHVRENSHGYEVSRLSVFDNVLNTLLQFAISWDNNGMYS